MNINRQTQLDALTHEIAYLRRLIPQITDQRHRVLIEGDMLQLIIQRTRLQQESTR